jgi:hypothetical protein
VKSLLVSRGDTSLCCLMSGLFVYCIFPLIFFNVVLFVSHLCWLERKWIETSEAAQTLKLRRPIPREEALELLRLSWLTCWARDEFASSLTYFGAQKTAPRKKQSFPLVL